MGTSSQKRAQERRKMFKRREKIDAKRQEIVANQGSNEMVEYLIDFLQVLHQKVFDTEKAEVANSGCIAHAMIAGDFFDAIAVNPPANLIPGNLLPVDHSMFYAHCGGGMPLIKGKTWRGIYAVNTDPFLNKWLAGIEKSYPGISAEALRDTQCRNIVQLIAHEVRHEIQYYTTPNRHHIAEIQEIKPEVYTGWHRQTLSVFHQNLTSEGIDNEEDAIVVEILVQNLFRERIDSAEALLERITNLVKY